MGRRIMVSQPIFLSLCDMLNHILTTGDEIIAAKVVGKLMICHNRGQSLPDFGWSQPGQFQIFRPSSSFCVAVLSDYIYLKAFWPSSFTFTIPRDIFMEMRFCFVFFAYIYFRLLCSRNKRCLKLSERNPSQLFKKKANGFPSKFLIQMEGHWKILQTI